jgi:predicted transcriptional regulator YheO
MNVSDLQVFARFLSEFFGGRAEVVLFDTKKVVSVHNPFDEDRAVGAPLGDVEQRLLSEQAYASSDYLANYRSLTRKREKLRSATFFIRGQSGEIAGMLTINLKVDRLIVRELERLPGGPRCRPR